MKIALITGITGQDGSYLSEYLLEKGYEVHGLKRRSSSFNTDRIDHILDKLQLHYGDLTDSSSIISIINSCRPDEIYNLGALSHVRISFDQPVYCHETIAVGTLNILEAVRRLGLKSKIYQASSSEMYGDMPVPQNEDTPFRPRSPYACAKACAFNQVVNYREAYGMFACNGILFNHESQRRGETFVTRKITRAVTRIKYGLQDHITLGNLDAKRDWGHAGDYVRAMHLMLQHDVPDDYVVATGTCYSVRDFLTAAFERVGIYDWRDYVRFDERYLRPTEVPELRGDASKIKRVLGWVPEFSFNDLVTEMINGDLRLAERERILLNADVRENDES